jgi:hypothetical protein
MATIYGGVGGSWWKLEAVQISGVASTGKAWAAKVANKRSVQNNARNNWAQMCTAIHNYGAAKNIYGGAGNYKRRLVNYAGTITKTAYNTGGAFARQIVNQNTL